MASKNSFNYQTRLFLLIVVFTWVLTFAFFMLQYTREKEYKADTLNAQLQVYNRELLRAIERDSLQNFLKVYNKSKKYDIILSKAGDNILYAAKKYESDVLSKR